MAALPQEEQLINNHTGTVTMTVTMTVTVTVTVTFQADPCKELGEPLTSLSVRLIKHGMLVAPHRCIGPPNPPIECAHEIHQ